MFEDTEFRRHFRTGCDLNMPVQQHFVSDIKEMYDKIQKTLQNSRKMFEIFFECREKFLRANKVNKNISTTQ